MDNNLDSEMLQGENPGSATVNTSAMPEMEEDAAAGTQPRGGIDSDSRPDSNADAIPCNEGEQASPAPRHADSAMEWEYLGEQKVEPKSHEVVQGRKSTKLDQKKVKSMEAVPNPETAFEMYEVYVDWDDGGQWAWDGAYRQEVFARKGMLVCVRRFKVKNAKKMGRPALVQGKCGKCS